jgi:hypothetical protein
MAFLSFYSAIVLVIAIILTLSSRSVRSDDLEASIEQLPIDAGGMASDPIKSSIPNVYLASGPSDPHDTFLILALTRLGWSNRLRCVADWYKIALMSGRKLVVVWDVTNDCNVHFSDVVESVSPDVNFLPYPEVNSRNILPSLHKSNLTYQKICENCKFIIQKEDMDAIFSKDIKIIYTDYDGVISLPNLKCQTYLAMHSEFFSTLIPKPNIEKAYNYIRKKLKGSLTVGIHVRDHDPRFDWEVVPPFDQSGKALKFGVGAHVTDFATVMQSIIDSFNFGNTDETLGSASQVMFFVASNSKVYKQMLVDTFPDHAITLMGDMSRDTNMGMVMAVIEWFILSRCDLIINTYGSTFALQAALLRPTPILGFYGHRLVFHHDARLPFCGDMNFIQAYSKNLTSSEYEEGTSDRRKVRGSIVTLRKSDLFSEWGIPEVFSTAFEAE